MGAEPMSVTSGHGAHQSYPAGDAERPLRELQSMIAPYERADDARAWRTVCTSVAPYVASWWLMWRSLVLPYWVTLLLALPTAGFLVRIFIVQHDCGHASFFRSSRLNTWVGRLCAVMTLTPYRYWQRFHAVHHATSSKLDRRAHFDVETLTVAEYLSRGRWARLRYRLQRSALVLFGIGPLFYFVVLLRLPFVAPRAWHRERRSILLTDLALAAAILALVRSIGLTAFVRVQLPITVIAATTGMWLFYVQHQFEHAYWARDDAWDYGRAALAGSSYYALPPVLEWFTGYIGLHHVHHLSTRIPSYRLAECLRETPVLSAVPRIELLDGFRTVRLKLWDEERGRLVPWPHSKTAGAQKAAS